MGRFAQRRDGFRFEVTDSGGIQFVLDQEYTPNLQLLGDSKRIGQILLNFLSNAFKFTAEGQVTLRCEKVENSLRFSVEDSGIGMSEEVLGRLFKPFEQADSSISRRFGGTGLGLHISWALAEMMGGSIQVRSQEGEGSTFILTLPYVATGLSVTPVVSDNIPGLQLEKVFTGHVLIAEDTPELQLLESRILQSMGDITITIVGDGEEAVRKASAEPFDLILMDMQMPVMNGLEATRTLIEQGNTTPVVALTANVMQRHKDQFFEAGAVDFLSKPIDRESMLRILNKFLKREERAPTPLQEKSGALAGLDNVPILIVDDDVNVLESYDQILLSSSYKYYFEEIENAMSGAAAVSKGSPFVLSKATQGEQGVELAQQALKRGVPFPVAFIDMRMPPGMDGLETAKRLRALDERIYIIIVSAYSDISFQQIKQELGQGILYIGKPFDGEEVLKVVTTLTELWVKEHGAESYLAPKESQAIEGIDQSAEREPQQPQEEAIQREDEVDDELMQIFVESTTERASALERALSNKEWAMVREIAHATKGSATSFGYPQLSRMAETVQRATDEQRLEDLPTLAMDLLIEMRKVLL